MQYILEQGACHGTVFNSCHTSFAAKKNPLTEIQEGELYLCLEHRTVRVRERMINLTSKEFDILALLIANPKRVFTYELITDLVWKEDCDFYSRTKNFPVMNGLQNSFSKSKIHTILSVGVLLYRPAFLLKVLPWKNVSRVFCDRCNFKKGADFSVKAW